MDWAEWLEKYGHTLSPAGLDRRILGLTDDFYRSIGTCPKTGHHFTTAEDMIGMMARAAAEIRRWGRREDGSLPTGVNIRNEFVTDNRFFALTFYFHFKDEEKGTRVTLCEHEARKVVDLEFQAKMFLN